MFFSKAYKQKKELLGFNWPNLPLKLLDISSIVFSCTSNVAEKQHTILLHSSQMSMTNIEQLRPSFFWDVRQRRLVVCYRRFGTIYRVGIVRCPETSVTTNLLCATSQKSE